MILSGHDIAVTSVLWLKSQPVIVTGSADKTLRLWHAATGAPLQPERLVGSTVGIVSVAAYEPLFSHNGNTLLAAGAYDGGIWLWKHVPFDEKAISIGNPPLSATSGNSPAVCFLDEKSLASGGRNGQCKVWDIETGIEMFNPQIGEGNSIGYPIEDMAVAPDGHLLAIAISEINTVKLYDTRTLTSTISFSCPDSLSCVAFSQDGTRLINGSYDQTLYIWDIRHPRQLGSPIRVNQGVIHSVTYSSNGTRFATGSDIVQVWDAELGIPIGSSAHFTRLEATIASSVAFSPDGSQLASAHSTGDVEIWQIESLIHNGLEATGVPENSLTWNSHDGAVDLTGKVVKDGEFPIGSGGFGDVFKANLAQAEDLLVRSPALVIKILRSVIVNQTNLLTFERRVKREIGMWQRIKHENVVPFIGISMSFGAIPAAISLFMPNGTVTSYLQEFPKVNRIELLRGVALGLEYLHSHKPEIVHGDMKAANILVSERGKPCITDFGISRVLDPSTFWNTTASAAQGSMRWMSPELLHGTSPSATTASDVWAYAMTSLEIMTNKVPFQDEYSRNEAVMLAVVLRDERPRKPSMNGWEMSPSLWNLWQEAWKTDPAERPGIHRVLATITNIARDNRPLRLLSLAAYYYSDSGFISTVFSLYCVRSVMEQVGGEKPFEYFDMMAGTGYARVVIYMLAELRMPIETCILEFSALIKLSHDLHAQTPPLERHIILDAIQKEITRILGGYSPQAQVLEHEGCKLVLLSNNYRTGGPAITHNYATANGPKSSINIKEGILSALLEETNITIPNPSETLLTEALREFGGHRKVGYLLSIGGNPSPSACTILENSLRKEEASFLTNLAVSTAFTDEKMKTVSEEGSYWRFDLSEREFSHASDPFLQLFGQVTNSWRWMLLASNVATSYLRGKKQKEKIEGLGKRMYQLGDVYVSA